MLTLLAGLSLTRKPQLAVVIAGNPECVAAGHRCRDIPAQTRAVVISPIGWRFEARQRVSEIRRRTYRDVRDDGAADPCPYLTVDRAQAAAVAMIVKVRALDTAPPGFCTVTEALPAAAISAAGIAAVSWVALTKVVVRFAPFQRTTEPLTKLLPFTVSVKVGSARRSAARREGGQRWRRGGAADLDDACDRRVLRFR